MRLLSTSDWHTCHRRTPTAHIIKNVERWFYTDVDLNKVDLIVNIGDVFDKYVENDNEDFLYTLDHWKKFGKKAAKAKTIVRLVEGTTLHDWRQSRYIQLAMDEENVDFKYIDKIEIEIFTQFNNLSVMYVPDNMAAKTPDEIWEIALTVLNANGLKKVDLIFIHGGFYFQLPEKGRKHAHMEERWESIVNIGIFNGHIHIPAFNGNMIRTNGSFDRIRHGEEHPKGGWDATIDTTTKKMEATFYENVNALPYTTIDINILDLPEHVVNKVKKLLQSRKWPKHSQFRIAGGSRAVVGPIVSSLSNEYPDYGFVEKSETDDVIIEQELYEKSDYVSVALTPANLFSYLYPEVEPKVIGTDISESDLLGVLGEFL